MMQYSVVTTCFNDAANIIPYLDNLFSQTQLPTEIVIADGGSTDNTEKVVNRYADEHTQIPIHFIGGVRLNIAQGFNTAIKAAQCDYVIVTGIGNKFEASCFEKLIRAAKSERADFYYPILKGNDANSFARKYNITFLRGSQGVDNPISLNHCVLGKKDALQKLGFYYEKFIYAGEDTEFFSRAYKLGYSSFCVKDASIYWDTPRSMKEFLKQIRVYTIGNIQIEGEKFFSNRLLQIKRFAAVAVAIICFIIGLFTTSWLFVPLGAAITWCVAKKILRLKQQSFWLRTLYSYLPLWYALRNRKYFSAEYRVNR